MTKPHISYQRGYWFCGLRPSSKIAFGRTPAEAYRNWKRKVVDGLVDAWPRPGQVSRA